MLQQLYNFHLDWGTFKAKGYGFSLIFIHRRFEMGDAKANAYKKKKNKKSRSYLELFSACVYRLKNQASFSRWTNVKRELNSK